MKTLLLTLSLITLPALAETVTLANGQRCTKLDNGQLVGCTAPTRADRDRDYAYPYQHRRYHGQARKVDKPSKPVSAGWTPRY